MPVIDRLAGCLWKRGVHTLFLVRHYRERFAEPGQLQHPCGSNVCTDTVRSQSYRDTDTRTRVSHSPRTSYLRRSDRYSTAIIELHHI